MKISPSILLARATKFCNKSSPTLVNRFNWFRKDLHIIQLNSEHLFGLYSNGFVILGA